MPTQPFFSPTYYQRSQMALEMALQTAPAYRSWQVLDPGASVPIDQRYACLPELTKQNMREHFPQGLVPNHLQVEEGLARKEIEYVATSGTTEEKVVNLWNQKWWNDSEAASWKLNARTEHLEHTHHEAQLASALSVGFRSERDLPMEDRILGRYLFLNEKISAQEWQEHHYLRMADELERFQPVIVEANPSLLARLAWWAQDHQRRLYTPQVILFTYEFPSALHLRCIQEVFKCPMASSFGSTETGYVFMQCEHGLFHQNTEYCRVDFQPLAEKHGGPGLGRILVTTFQNPWAAVVRFDVGDLVRLADQSRCACGRQEGYLLSGIEGRIANATFTSDGRLVSTKALDDRLATIPGIRDYQLVQSSRLQHHLELVITSEAHDVLEPTLSCMRRLYGEEIKVAIEMKAEIEPAASGKYRRTRTLFDFDWKGLFA